MNKRAALDRFDHGTEAVAGALSAIAAAMIVALMFITVLDVGLRLLNMGSVRGGLEWTEVALVIAVYFGLMSAEVSSATIRTGIVTERLARRPRHVLRVIGMFVTIGFLLYMVDATLAQALPSIASQEFRFGVVAVPVWPAKAVIPLGLFGLAVAAAVRLIREFRNPGGDLGNGDAAL